MRGTKAKAMRKADPSRPNPGRRNGGTNKIEVHRKLKEEGNKRSIRGLKRLIKKGHRYRMDATGGGD